MQVLQGLPWHRMEPIGTDLLSSARDWMSLPFSPWTSWQMTLLCTKIFNMKNRCKRNRACFFYFRTQKANEISEILIEWEGATSCSLSIAILIRRSPSCFSGVFRRHSIIDYSCHWLVDVDLMQTLGQIWLGIYFLHMHWDNYVIFDCTGDY